MEGTQKNEKKRIIGKPFEKGNPGGPGAPKLSEEQKLVKKEVKKWLKEHEEGLAEMLPETRKALKEALQERSMAAIQEIHKVLGAYKREMPTTAIQINFRDDDL